MKTFILTIDDKYENVINSPASALDFEIEQISEDDENLSLYSAIEFGKQSGRMTESESLEFIESLKK